jgi:hypothetical protein
MDTPVRRARLRPRRALRPLTIGFIATVLAVPLATLGSMSAAQASSASPTLTVKPTGHLGAGSVVSVRMTHLPWNTPVRLVQCNQFDPNAINDESPYCPDLADTTSNGSGQVTDSVTLNDPVFVIQPFGDDQPLYCRSQQCRLFAVWTNQAGTVKWLSAQLWFTGSPATIAASPSTGLADGQRVHVTGTAIGASGRTVDVVEEACYDIIQGSGCYGTEALGSAVVGLHGGWSLYVNVTRLLADGTDCADSANILGACQLTARVLTGSGQPDNTYGVASLGQPGASLTFSTSG